jgi:hypothetical protein
MEPQLAMPEHRETHAIDRRSHVRDRGYHPPAPGNVHIVTVGDLIGNARQIIKNQQARLGFEAEGLEMRVWCAGDTALVQKRSVAIVGTRKVSDLGAARARRLAKELAEEGLVVYSGLAKGIDTEALQCRRQSGSRDRHADR